MLGNCRCWEQTIILLLTITHRRCDVQLTRSVLICGQLAVLNCTASPFDGISWNQNANTLLDCYPSGFCDLSEIGNMSFSVDKQSSTYSLTINPLVYSVHQNNVYLCSDPSETKNVTLDVTVPLTSVEVNTTELSTGVFELSARTNCLKQTENVVFNWTCMQVNANQNISGVCNVSTVKTATETSSCDTGGYCMGPGLQKFVNVLTFENYSGEAATDDVKITLTVTSMDGTFKTYTSPENFKLEKVSHVLVSGEKHGHGDIVVVLIVLLACILLIAVAIALYWIKRYKPCKVSQDNSRNPDSHSQQTEDVRPNHESSDRSSRTGNENVIPLLSTSPELSEVKETFKATEHL